MAQSTLRPATQAFLALQDELVHLQEQLREEVRQQAVQQRRNAYLVAVGEKDGINAIRRAFEALKENLLGTVICSLVLSLVGSLGAILCGVGVFLTLPIAFIGFYHMARQITDGGPLAITRA